MSSSSRDPNDLARGIELVRRYTQQSVRSVRDVRAYLARRRIAPSVAARVIAACRARGILDDEAAARLWAEQWARRGYARAAIRVKLAAKGFEESAIERAGRRLEALSDDDQAQSLVAAYRNRQARPSQPHVPSVTPSSREASRLARMLSARGFDADVIERVVQASFE